MEFYRQKFVHFDDYQADFLVNMNNFRNDLGRYLRNYHDANPDYIYQTRNHKGRRLSNEFAPIWDKRFGGRSGYNQVSRTVFGGLKGLHTRFVKDNTERIKNGSNLRKKEPVWSQNDLAALQLYNGNIRYKDNGLTTLLLGSGIDVKLQMTESLNEILVNNGLTLPGAQVQINGMRFSTIINKTPLYTPETVMAFDFNRAKGYMCVFNNDFAPSFDFDNYYSLVQKYIPLNPSPKALKAYSRSVRKSIRSQWLKLRRLLNYYAGIFANELIEEAILNKSVIGIDNITSNLDFGYEMLITRIQSLCENKGVPFVKVPTPYTSIGCPICSSTAKKNRKNMIHKKYDSFICIECGYYVESADKKAAQFIADWAWHWWFTKEAPAYYKNMCSPNHLARLLKQSNNLKSYRYEA